MNSRVALHDSDQNNPHVLSWACRLLNLSETSHFRTKSYHENLLFLHGLEATMTELGGGVDKLEVDLLLGTTACLHQQRLREREQEPSLNIPKLNY